MASPQVETLSHDGTWLQLVPELGGAVIGYASEGREAPVHWMRQVELATIEEAGAIEASSYPLVPFSNRIAHGCFRYSGREVSLPADPLLPPHAIHGHGWRAAWEVTERAEASIVLKFRHASDSWPWQYEAVQRFALDETGLRIEMELINQSETNMPAGLGIHPHFPAASQVRLKTGVTNAHVGDETLLPIAQDADYPAIKPLSEGASLPEGLDLCFGGWNGSAEILWPEENRGLRISASPEFGHVVIFTPPGKDFFCVEPVSHCVNAVNLEGTDWGTTGLVHLSPQQSFKATALFQPFFI